MGKSDPARVNPTGIPSIVPVHLLPRSASSRAESSTPPRSPSVGGTIDTPRTWISRRTRNTGGRTPTPTARASFPNEPKRRAHTAMCSGASNRQKMFGAFLMTPRALIFPRTAPLLVLQHASPAFGVVRANQYRPAHPSRSVTSARADTGRPRVTGVHAGALTSHALVIQYPRRHHDKRRGHSRPGRRYSRGVLDVLLLPGPRVR